MRTPREIAHVLLPSCTATASAPPGTPHWSKCDEATAAIENARADGMVLAIRRELRSDRIILCLDAAAALGVSSEVLSAAIERTK